MKRMKTYTVTLNKGWFFGDDPFSPNRCMKQVVARTVRISSLGEALFLGNAGELIYAMAPGAWVTVRLDNNNSASYAVAT